MTAALALPADAPLRRVALRPVPRREPPFDDERRDGAVVTRLDRHLPFEPERERPGPWLPRSPRPNGLPEPSIWARRLVVGMVETASGRRPLAQLAAFLTPSVHRGLRAEFDRAAAGRSPHWMHRAGVRSVHVSEPADGVVELCAVLDTGRRSRALAMRVEAVQGHWRCTRLQMA